MWFLSLRCHLVMSVDIFLLSKLAKRRTAIGIKWVETRNYHTMHATATPKQRISPLTTAIVPSPESLK